MPAVERGGSVTEQSPGYACLAVIPVDLHRGLICDWHAYGSESAFPCYEISLR